MFIISKLRLALVIFSIISQMSCGDKCACIDCKCENCDCKIEAVSKEIEIKCCITEEKKLSPEIEAKLDTLLSIGEECITRDELAALLEKKPDFIAYDGFEPSGRMHIAQVNRDYRLLFHY